MEALPVFSGKYTAVPCTGTCQKLPFLRVDREFYCACLIFMYFWVLFQEEFKEMIEAAGFRCVTYENLNFGVVAIHSGFKL